MRRLTLLLLSLLLLVPVANAGMLFPGEGFPIRLVLDPVAGDVDGDGRSDLVALDAQLRVNVLRALPDGGFEPFGTPFKVSGVILAVGDADGDAIADLTIGTDGSLDLWKGRGDGSFDSPFVTPIPGPLGPYFDSPFADFDGDGRLDVVVQVDLGPMLIAFGGPAGFEGVQELPAAPWYASAAFGDATGDGGPDLIVGIEGEEIRAYAATGTRILGEPVRTPLTNGAGVRLIADLDGDGIVDALLGGWATHLAGGLGDGRFREGVPAGIPDPCGGPNVSGDWDLDGDVDVACSPAGNDEGRASLWFNDGTGSFGDPRLLPSHFSIGSLRAVRGATAFPGFVTITWRTPPFDRLFVFPSRPTPASAVPPMGESPGAAYPSSLHTGFDVDGDGDEDWITGAFANGVWWNDGEGKPTPSATYEPISEVVVAADFDGDGRADLVEADSTRYEYVFRRGRGEGTFEPAAAGIPYELGEGKLTAADLDRDGATDLISSSGYGGLRIHRGRGDGTFDDAVFAMPPFTHLDGNVVPVDLDGDGDLDLAGSSFWNGITLLHQDGDGSWREPEFVPNTFDTFGIAAGDVNGDGSVDFVRVKRLPRSLSHVVEVLLRAEDGTYSPQRTIDIQHLLGYRIYLEDLDGDGALDAVAAAADTGTPFLTIVIPAVGGAATPQPRFFYTPGWVVPGDANGDGLPDLTALGAFGNSLSYGPAGLYVLLNASRPPNSAPLAVAGDDQVLECASTSGATATLDGSGSSDDGAIASWVWSSPAIESVFGEVAEATFPLGAHDVTLTVTDDAGLTGTDATQVVVRDTTAPSGAITAPQAGACFGPAALPVLVTDSFADVCDPAIERTWTPAGPSIEEHGDHAITVAVTDVSQNAASDSVAFTIDTTPPEVTLASPGGPWVAGQLVGLSVLFTATDDDGAAGEVATERILLSDCLLLDGTTYGDADGLLSDESIVLSPGLLCEAASRCGWTTLPEPELRVEAVDCGGNVGSASHRFAGSLRMRPGVCGRVPALRGVHENARDGRLGARPAVGSLRPTR